MEEFRQAYTQIVDFLKSELPTQFELPEEYVNYIDRVINYNVPHGKLNRGLAVVDTYKIVKGADATEEGLFQARVVGWCIEWLQAFFLVADDIMDGSLTRRGQPCWYKLDDVKLVALNDYIILESQIYRLLKHYFKNDARYLPLVELFHEVTYQTELGQLMDTKSQPEKGVQIDFSRYTLDLYKRIVKYKTAFYSFYLPLAAGLIVSGITDEKDFKLTHDISMLMGEYFQIQDDYLDCFGDYDQLGKIGRDIQEGKCCWMVCKALLKIAELPDAAEREQLMQVLKSYYGKEENPDAVKDAYRKLDMIGEYKAYEAQAIAEIRGLIAQVQNFPGEIFLALLSKIENRTK